MSTAQKLMTAEEFAQLPESPGGEQLELVRGVVVMAPPPETGHGRRAFKIGSWLARFVESHDLGEVTGEGGYLLARDPDIVRAPDTAWLSKERVSLSMMDEGYVEGAPELAVEVVSRTDRDTDIADKVADYLRFGARRVWVVRGRQQTVTVFAPGGHAHVYSIGDTLTSEEAGFPVAGFALPVASIFE
jgi:Uma2 family endonuclease